MENETETKKEPDKKEESKPTEQKQESEQTKKEENKKPEHKHTKFSFSSSTLTIILAAILLIVAGINVYMNLPQTSSTQQTNIPPAQIQVITISADNCNVCFDISNVVPYLKQLDGVNITSEKALNSASTEAKQLISKYGITKLPTFIITGQINDSRISGLWSQIGEVKDNAVIFTQVPPPYFDISSSKIIGLVNYTAITDPNCTQCLNLSDIISAFKMVGVAFDFNKTLNDSQNEAKQLISKYNITKLPAIIFTPDLEVYSIINQSWPNIGKIAEDGSYILTEVVPFKEVATGKIRGIVDVIYLVDNNCTACYNVSIHKNILTSGYNVRIGNETTYDISSQAGKALLAKYNITKVPTFIMSPDAAYYPQLMQIWSSVGTNQTDGWFVFRAVEQLNNVVYFDLLLGKEVNSTS